MKNKSTRHKENNIFKFQPFSERISNLDINVFYRIGHENEAQAEDETACHFYQTIEKWNVLNLTESYGNFKKEIKPFENITLTQLLYNKDHIAKVLLEHLKRKDVLCLQALLEVLVAFVQDLHVDFYQYYPDFLNVLIDLLNTKDTEQLEWTFIGLAYIFKLLWRILIKNIDIVFNLLLPLLSDDRPEYINNFAAEGFAFVARKVKDKKSFLLMVLRTVQDTKDGISGSGRLLFEIVKGVNGQFHSCCEDWFSLYFELLQDNKFSSTLFKIMEEVIKHTVHNIHFQNSEVFWRIVTKYIHDTLLGWRIKKKEKYLNQMLQCVGQAIEYRAGRFLLQPNCVIGELTELFSIEELPEDILLSATKIVILLLLSKNIGLSQEQASLLTRTVLNVQIVNVFLFFIENIFQYSSFEALILPSFLQYCLKCGLDDRSLKILAKLIQTKAPLVGSGVDVHNLGKYLIDFNSGPSSSLINDVLLKHITINKADIYRNENNYVYSLICLPHIKNTIEIEKLLFENIATLCEIIEDGQNIKRCLFLLLITLESTVRITAYSKLTKFQDSLFRYILPLCNSIDYISALKILDMFLTITKEETVNMENMMVIHKSLEKNFSSPYHEVRLYTTHIYSLFDPILNQQHVNANEEWSLFSTCYKIQCIRPHVHSYREQLIYFDKLNFDRPQMFLCKETEFATVPVRYLCGTLYMNFKLLWDPVIKIIASHANGLEMNTFWQVFVEELKMVVVNIAKEEDEIETCSFSCDLIDELYSNTYRVEVKPDFSNYRLLLWKAMSFFPEVAEAKTRDVSALLLDFVENEYVKSSTENAITWNIKQNDPPDTSNIMDDNLEETEKDEETEFPAKPKGKYNMKTLIQHLEVFAKIRSAKSMYREPELYKLYFDLLSHKNSAVQKVALDCIMTYKFKYLTPYKEHLYNLIDDKNFKNEVVAFKVDPESSMIQEEHRTEVIPMIMNIVFSKMVSKTGLRTGGKSSGQFRRNIIFRFLAGCRQNEMMNFIHMAFRYYNNYLNTDQVLMINTIFTSISLEKFIPPKRLQSSLNMMHVVLEQFGALMGNELLNYLIKVMLIIGAFIKVGFEQQSKLHAGYVLLFRNMRTSCIKILNKVFSLFENYPWTSNEINAIYDVFVWPYLSKLPMEGIHSPTALLKLLATWGTYPHYFHLLVKHHDDDKDLYPLSVIISLLLNEKSHISVYNLILEVIEKLLTLEVGDEDKQIQIPVTNELPISKDLMEKLYSKENFNYGSCILLPHASRVLQKLKRKLESKSRSVNQRELSILSRISELVWEPEISDKLLQLLIPIVFKKCQHSNEEEILQLITTLNNLLVNVLHPETHLKQVSPLFGEVTHVSCRKLLCQLLHTMSKKTYGQFTLIDEIMAKMNAWDSKWVNQPDFQVRGDTFKQVQTMILEDSISLELGVLLIYNCIYVLKNEKDLALKENASHCMKTIAPYLVKKYSKTSDRNYILDETLFHLIRQTLKSKNSDSRNECILLLGCLSRECPDAHVVLRDLQKLTNSQDLEVDFFENLTHLQVHRHGRALLRFSGVYKEELTLPNIRTLTQFVLPLTTHYFCNEKYKDKHSLIDAANDALGTICRLLPWHQYEGLLKFYLFKLRRKVDYQKQLVKLIVTILDSFHFNLCKAQLENEIAQNPNNTVSNEAHLNASQIEEKVDVSNENVRSSEEEGVDIEAILDELEKIKEDNEEDEEQNVPMEKATYSIKAYEKITVLCKSAATRVVRTIQIALLPQLHKILAEMTHHESNHKINRKKISAEKEEEDLLRVPISLALVKLLQKLPKGILDSNLPGIFIKLCTFLKSHLESVRRVARETLQKIMTTLGPSYLGLLLDEMVPLLSKGFQVHVLVYTVHAVLVSLKEMFKPKDIDIVLNTVIKLCNADLFGILAEEKEIEKIISKVFEAKSTKSFDTYHILGQYITEKCMMDLVLPIKEILSTSHSFKTVNKAQECLRHIALGLIDNDFIPSDSLLKFSFGIANEGIPQLFGPDKPTLAEKERDKLKSLQPDCFIIPKEPVYKSGHRISSVRFSSKTNVHIMIEFGLKLCHLLLKRDKIRDAEFQAFLDPFVPIFMNCLTSKNVKLNTVTLQCLAWILKYELPSLKDNITEIVKSLFEILHKYGAAGLSKGENFDLVVAAFKVMTILVRDVKYFIVDTEQLKTLLLYVEQDLYDHERQAIAFGLLKAILCRKLVTSELFDIMNKVAELSITSELPHVRLQSRNVSHQFLMDYPLGKRLDKHVTFYLAQFKYEVKTGRESALEMMQTLINSFPIKILKEYSGTFLVTLGARLINDPEPSCKKMVADCINSMFNRLSYSDREPLFNIIKVWLSEDNVTHRQLATQLCGILVTVEKATFERRLHSLMPLLKSQFDTLSNNNRPGKFVRLRKENEEINSEALEKKKDHHLFQTLQLLLKISAQCPIFLKQVSDVEEISKYTQQLLAYPHEWVRLGAAQFLGFVLSSIDIKQLEELLLNNSSGNGYLHSDPYNDIKSLTLNLCDQLHPNGIKSNLAEQVVKNLVFIARVLQNIPINGSKINLLWLTRRMRKIVNSEIVETPANTTLRTEVFKWIAGIVTVLDLNNLQPILHHLLAPLVREMVTTDESETDLRRLSKDVANLIKKKIGMEKYTDNISKLEQQLSIKRAERKRSRNQLAVTDPEIFAKKKIKHHEKKKEAKKRKISERKGSVKKFKRKKLAELDSSEIM